MASIVQVGASGYLTNPFTENRLLVNPICQSYRKGQIKDFRLGQVIFFQLRELQFLRIHLRRSQL